MKSKFPIIITSLFLVTLFSPFVVSAEKVHLTNNSYDQKDPHYSPDGTKIVYSSEEDGDDKFDIWVMDADGTNHIQLTNQQYDQTNPIWSPDGQRIAYGSAEDGEQPDDLWIMNSDGSNHIQLAASQSDYNVENSDIAPHSFSPDGSLIAYTQKNDPNGGGYTFYHNIFTIKTDGSGGRSQLTDLGCPCSAGNVNGARQPAFSPDGTKIVYSSTEDEGSKYDLWSMDSGGSNHIQLTFDGAQQIQPMFNPQGNRVVYASKQDGGDYYDIWIMKPDGSNQIQLGTEDNDQLEPSFNDDGSMIVYESDEDGLGIIDIWTLDYTPSPNQSPSASVSANPTSGSSPLAVSFTGSGSDSDGSIASYSWDFGDSDSSSESSPSHTYQNVGSFTAILTVTDDEGATDTASIEIVVNEPGENQPPSAAADAYPTSGSAPLWVSFTGSGSDSDGSRFVTYSWDFGDGTSSTEQDPSHMYQNAGTFTATLTVTDDDGATDTSTILIDTYGNENGADADSTSEGGGTSNIPGFSVLVAISAICVAATTINSRKKRRLNECDDINSV